MDTNMVSFRADKKTSEILAKIKIITGSNSQSDIMRRALQCYHDILCVEGFTGSHGLSNKLGAIEKQLSVLLEKIDDIEANVQGADKSCSDPASTEKAEFTEENIYNNIDSEKIAKILNRG